MRTVLSAALVAGTLLFSLGAHADDRGQRSWNSERHHYDRDRHDDRRWNDRRYRDRDRGHNNWNRYDRGYRYQRPSYRSYSTPRRYYWRENSRWYHGYPPRGFRGSYYSYRPSASYGQLIISVPLW